MDPTTNGTAHNGVSSNGNGHHSSGAVTYDEVRRAVVMLGVFTPADLAGTLRISLEVADQFITALLWHGIIYDTEQYVEGVDGPEVVYEYEQAGSWPWPRPRHTPPEVQAVIESGGFLLYDQRGVTVRLSHKGEKGRIMSTPGARQKQKLRDLNFDRMQKAVRERADKQRKKHIARTQHKSITEVD